jgi:hypothetical protein
MRMRRLTADQAELRDLSVVVFVVVVIVLCVPVSVMEVVEVVVVRHQLMPTIHAVHVIGVIVAVLPVGRGLGSAHILLLGQSDATSIRHSYPRMSGVDQALARCAGRSVRPGRQVPVALSGARDWLGFTASVFLGRQ